MPIRPENAKRYPENWSSEIVPRHNRYDAPTRRAGIKARRHAARASGDLFQCEEASVG